MSYTISISLISFGIFSPWHITKYVNCLFSCFWILSEALMPLFSTLWFIFFWMKPMHVLKKIIKQSNYKLELNSLGSTINVSQILYELKTVLRLLLLSSPLQQSIFAHHLLKYSSYKLISIKSESAHWHIYKPTLMLINIFVFMAYSLFFLSFAFSVFLLRQVGGTKIFSRLSLNELTFFIWILHTLVDF